MALSIPFLSGCAETMCLVADIRCGKAEKAVEECKALENREFDECRSRVMAASMACSSSRTGCGADDPLPERFRTRGSGGPAWY